MKTSSFLLCSGLMLCLACSPQKKKETAKSANSEPNKTEATTQESADQGLALGEVDYKVGNQKGEITHFEKDHTDLTVSEDQIVLRIRNMKDLNFMVGLHGKGIQENPVHNYVPLASANKGDAFKHMINIVGLKKDDIMNPYKVSTGTFKVEQMNLENGKVKAKITGQATRARDVNNEHPVDFSLDIDMQVDNVINMVQPQ